MFFSDNKNGLTLNFYKRRRNCHSYNQSNRASVLFCYFFFFKYSKLSATTQIPLNELAPDDKFYVGQMRLILLREKKALFQLLFLMLMIFIENYQDI